MGGFSTPVAGGITRLSELIIDGDKDWGAYGISNIGTVIVTDGAGHYMELPSLTTAQRNALTPSNGMTIWNSSTGQVEKYDGAAWGAVGVTTFLRLSDTPASYIGHGGEVVKVKGDESALELAAGGITGVTVRKNTQMPVIGVRPQLNLIEGAAVDIKIADNPPDDEIDITVSAKYPTRFMTLIPEDASLPTTNPAAKATVDGTNFAYDVLDFDHTTEESANWEWYLTPDYLMENIVVDIFWESAGAGDAKFGFSVLGREKGDTWDAALGAEQTVVTTNLGAGKLNKSRIATFSPNWSPGDALLFKLARKAGDALDTIDANDVRVLKVVVSYTGQFAQSFYPLPEPVELTKPSAFAWGDIDVSEYVPVGATGVVLYIVNDTTGGVQYGVRKKGSTDDRHSQFLMILSHAWAAIGIDENRKFQLWYESDGDFKVYLVAYTATGVVFFDNAYDKSLGATVTWTEVDCSAECPGAIGVILEVQNANSSATCCAFRKKGSSDDRYANDYMSTVDRLSRLWVMIGVDGAQKYENKISSLDVDVYLVGYITQGAVFLTDGVDISLDELGVWTEKDLSATCPSGIMVFLEMNTRDPDLHKVGVRKKGSTEDYLERISTLTAMCALTSGQLCEIKQSIVKPSVGLFVIGYAQWAGA